MNIGNKILGFILTVALLLPVLSQIGTIAFATETIDIWDGTAAVGFESGTGTETDPYIIKTPEQLAYLASAVNAGTTYEGKYIKLANDIYLNDTANWENWGTTPPKNMWTPIGTLENSFSGTFNGDGHSVYGMYTDGAEDYRGLFGRIYGCLNNTNVGKSHVCGKDYTGGICGLSNGSITGCNFSGRVIGNDNVGGICGINYGTGMDGCRSEGNVRGNQFVGGVCGYYSISAAFSECNNDSDVSGIMYVGGICGYLKKCYDFHDCNNTGSVTGIEYRIGGICGNADSVTTYNLFNSGTVSGGSSVGGIFGYNTLNKTKNCSNTGAVSGNTSVGGISGECHDSTEMNKCRNKGSVNGESCVGGICGTSNHSSSISSFNIGTVNGSSDYVGGIFGYSTAAAAVRDSYNTAKVTGAEYVGGLCGYSDYVIFTSYNVGTVNGNFCVGGVCGKNCNIIKYCYYLEGCAADGNGTVQNGVGSEFEEYTTADEAEHTEVLTLDEMKLAESFDEFNFTEVWTMGVITGYDYPTLAWQENDVEPTQETTIHEETTEAITTAPNTEKVDDKQTISPAVIIIIVVIITVVIVIGFVVGKVTKRK